MSSGLLQRAQDFLAIKVHIGDAQLRNDYRKVQIAPGGLSWGCRRVFHGEILELLNDNMLFREG